MTLLFRRVLSMSLSASVVILAVLLARLLLSRAPKKWSYLLWAAVEFRLCCPVSVRSVVSLFSVVPQSEALFSPITPSGAMAALPPAVEQIALERVDWLTVAAWVWAAVAVLMLLSTAIRYLRLRRLLADAVRMEENIYITDRIAAPFVLGLFCARIYLPTGLEGENLTYVLAHERYHVQQKDLMRKTLTYLLLCVHWFNPLCWLFYYMMNRDMELQCDEAVLMQLGDAAAYSDALLHFAYPGHVPLPSAMAFGESDIACRVKNALRWRTPKHWVIVLSATVFAVVFLICITSPANRNIEPLDSHTDLLLDGAPYSAADLTSAVEAIEERFQMFGGGADGFVLQRLEYESQCNAEQLQWLNEHPDVPGAGTFTEGIYFLSDFKTPANLPGDGFNSDAVYTDWGWWLARAPGGDWVLVDMGY